MLKRLKINSIECQFLDKNPPNSFLNKARFCLQQVTSLTISTATQKWEIKDRILINLGVLKVEHKDLIEIKQCL